MSTTSTTSSAQGDPIYRGDYSEFFATADMPPPALVPTSPMPSATITELLDTNNLTILADAATTTKETDHAPALGQPARPPCQRHHSNWSSDLLEEGELKEGFNVATDELERLMQIVVDLRGITTNLEVVQHINQTLMEATAAVQSASMATACAEALTSLRSIAAEALDLEALRANLPSEWDSLASIDTTTLTIGPNEEDHPGHPYHRNLPSS